MFAGCGATKRVYRKQGTRLDSVRIAISDVTSVARCWMRCGHDDDCVAVNYNHDAHQCELISSPNFAFSKQTTSQWDYYGVDINFVDMGFFNMTFHSDVTRRLHVIGCCDWLARYIYGCPYWCGRNTSEIAAPVKVSPGAVVPSPPPPPPLRHWNKPMACVYVCACERIFTYISNVDRNIFGAFLNK